MARTLERRPPHLAGSKGSQKIRCAEPKNQPTLLILVVAGNHPRPPVHVVQSERGMSFQSCGLQMRMLSHGILIMGSTSRAGGLGSSERFIWHEERERAGSRVRAWPRDSVRQEECTPRDTRAGQGQNMPDRCGHVRRNRLTFELFQAEDELRGLRVFHSC